ncbi:hypothetical protein AAE121_003660 [Salmonella enterica]
MITAVEEDRNMLLGELADHIFTEISGHGFSDELAEQLSVNIVDFISDHFGGHTLSFPKDLKFKRSKRNQLIYEDHCRGMHWGQLARKYNMHDRTIKRIVHRLDKQMGEKLQPDMFNGKD